MKRMAAGSFFLGVGIPVMRMAADLFEIHWSLRYMCTTCAVRHWVPVWCASFSSLAVSTADCATKACPALLRLVGALQ